MLTGKGIWTTTSKRFSHSTRVSALSPYSLPITPDTNLESLNPTTNFSSNNYFGAGNRTVPNNTMRAWIKPDFSDMPVGLTFSRAFLLLTYQSDSSNNARTLSIHRCLRDVVATQATWNIWKTANNWGTAGASNSTTDYDGAVILGTATQPASPTVPSQLQITLDAVELQKLYDGTYTNNGLIMFVDTQSDDQIVYYSSDEVIDTSQRPVIEVYA